MLKDFFQGFFVAFLVLIIFLNNPAFAYATSTQSIFFEESNPFTLGETATDLVDEQNSDTTNSDSDTATVDDFTDSTNDSSTSSGSTAGCSVSKLSAKEASNILDIAHDGFDGKTMSDGKGSDSNNDAVDLNGLGLIANANDGNTAVKITPPTEGSAASRYGVFDKVTITGPWGIGLVLDDTLRVGRCEGTSQEDCRIMGDGENYRTSGVGIKEGFSNAFSSLGDLTARTASGVSEEDYEKMQNNVFDNDENNLTSYSVESTDAIKNSFKTTSYTAKKSSNCNNVECVIATYSSFDKYFNSWYSVDMIVSSFGPTLMHKAGKLMGIGNVAPEGSFWSKTGAFFDNAVNKAKSKPLEAIGLDRLSRYKKIVQEYPALRPVFDSQTIQKKLFSSGQGGLTTEMFKADGLLTKLSAEEKKAFFKASDHLRSWIKLQSSKVSGLKKQYSDIINDLTLPLAQRQAAQVEYAKEFGKIVNDYDDMINLDFPEWLKDSGTLSQLSNFNIMKASYGTGGASGGVVNMATEGSFNFKKAVISPFNKTGNWSDYVGKITDDAYKVDNMGNLLLYELKRDGKLLSSNVGIDDLIKRMGQGAGTGTVAVKIPGQAELMELNESTIKNLTSRNITTVELYTSDWSPKMITENGVTRQAVWTPNEYAAMMTQDRIVGRVANSERNMDEVVNVMRQDPNYAARKSWNLYDEQLVKEKDFVFDYFKKPFEVGIWKGTVLPIAYWNLKRGVGFEQISGYMLPDKWSDIEIYQGTDKIYQDSYTDFYANEGSDQGDLFMKAISSGIFVWKMMADEFTKDIAPVFYDSITRAAGSAEGIPTGGLSSKTITRDVVGDVAFYSHNENCSGCSGRFDVDSQYIQLTTSLPVNIQAFLVEAVDQATAQEKGTTLIAFTHHSDIKGKTSDIEGDKIALIQARSDGTTCEQALKETGLGFVNPKVAGLVLAGGETFSYAVFGLGAGITATALQQVMFTRKLQDCVDDLDGYYIHFFSPASYNKTTSKQTVSNEMITDSISKLSEGLTKTISSSTETGNPISDSLQKINADFQNFADQANNDNILQANIQLLPPSKGKVTGKEVFYIWYKENAATSGYKTEGKLVVKDGNKELIFDNETGELKYNGKTILGSDKADHTRMATTPSDNRIPGIVVPMTLNRVSAPETKESVFELYSNGEILIKNSEVLACIQKAVKDQTGIEYNGNELTAVFGKLNGLSTDTYEKIFASNGVLSLEGSGPRIEGSGSAKLIVDGYWDTRVIIDSNKNADTGKFEGMTFEHGSIVLKEETNELIIWLRQHKESVLSNKEVSGLKAKLDSVLDPDSGCPVPAINLEAIGQAGDELGQQRVKNFNTSMDHLGPFTQFTTDSKIYEFYAKRDGNSGECKDYFRIRDKETGDIIYDGEIKGGIKQAEDGTLSFETTDGKQHELKFDAENGVPKLTYNNGAPETLLTAQGPNGSFWYDPNTGLWYPENGLQIPLNQAFKDNGTLFASDGKGGVVGTAQNPVTLNVGSQTGQGISLPSLPETLSGYLIFITSFLMISYYLTQKIKKKKQ